MASASPSPSASWRTDSTPAAQTVFPDEILEEIFVRLDAAADLVRVSATCYSFRRIVSEHRFLRRFQSLHSPPVLGFINRAGYGHQGFLPVEPPHRSAPEARALEQAADFTFSFLPDPSAWRFLHARDGRALLGRRISTKTQFLDFLVCDPLHRRYVKIPRIPTTQWPPPQTRGICRPFSLHLVRMFRIICSVQHIVKGKVMVFIFSSCNQMWQGIISTIHLPDGFIRCNTYYAHRCLYWLFYGNDYHSLMFDTSEMKFSIIELPTHSFHSICVVEAADGRLGFLTIGDGTMDLYSKNRQSNGVGAQEWQHDKLIPLPKESGINCIWDILGTVGRYVALAAHGGISSESLQNSEHFVLDIKTLLIEKLCSSNNSMLYGGFPYAKISTTVGTAKHMKWSTLLTLRWQCSMVGNISMKAAWWGVSE